MLSAQDWDGIFPALAQSLTAYSGKLAGDFKAVYFQQFELSLR
jgi:hypothetical protein